MPGIKNRQSKIKPMMHEAFSSIAKVIRFSLLLVGIYLWRDKRFVMASPSWSLF